MLSVADLSVSYGNIAALRGVSLEVHQGEIVAVIGANGAGKSTLLNTIAGVVRAQAGAARFAGAPILDLAPERRVALGLSLVPEGRHIFASLTVGENIELGATTRRDRRAVEEDRERVLELFPILRERYGQRAGKLSGGEQQMLAIARALLARPRLLLIDEPSLGLAPLVVSQVYDSMEALRRSGVTILVVEQNVNRALRTADRTYVMQSGLIAMGGDSATLRDGAALDAAYFGVSGASARQA